MLAGLRIDGMASRMRADRLLVERGLFESRTKAQAAIAAGLVTAQSVVVRKPSDEIPIEAVLEARPEHPYVSRGGVKLAAALEHFGFDPGGRVCLDVGASTGGFTEVLIARNARRVYAVDVGHGQLHARLRDHPSIVSLEGTDIRSLDLSRLPEPPDFVVVDVSFISLTLALPSALVLARRPARLVALIKPQFEAGPVHLKNGIVRDPVAQEAACRRIAAHVEMLQWDVVGIVASPLRGGDGNREFLLGAGRD